MKVFTTLWSLNTVITERETLTLKMSAVLQVIPKDLFSGTNIFQNWGSTKMSQTGISQSLMYWNSRYGVPNGLHTFYSAVLNGQLTLFLSALFYQLVTLLLKLLEYFGNCISRVWVWDCTDPPKSPIMTRYIFDGCYFLDFPLSVWFSGGPRRIFAMHKTKRFLACFPA